MDEDRRPDPQRILERIQADAGGRGRLTVFLGAAPGVGKTYAMLEAAHEHAAKGLDVAIGWLDTHGRKETEALAEGIERLPERQVEYHGVTLREMDLDALLARRPLVALVDELAHTNAPGSRHTKRYQDVEELLDAGIHVFTTLNIQHLESLNDVVQQITGVEVRETVPDRVVDEAAEIRLVDLPPEELIHRLEEGKVYIPEQAGRALRRFFRAGNLNALRELALRKTTERVGGQLDTYMHRHEIEGPWAVRDNILVCVGPSPFGANLIRAARRIAAQTRSNWVAVTVEQPSRALDAAAKERLAAHTRLAEELGGEVAALIGDDVAETLTHFARQHNVTQIVIGKPLKSRVTELWRGSLADRLARLLPGVDIHVIPGEHFPQQRRLRIFPALRPKASVRAHVEVVLGVAALTAALVALRPYLTVLDLNLIYLLPVLVAAARWGNVPAISAAILSVLCLDFFFVPPFYTLTVAQPRNAFTLLIFLVVGIITSSLASRLRSEAEAAQTREARTAALYRLSRAFVAVEDLQHLLELVAEEVGETFAGTAAIFLPDDADRLALRAVAPRARSAGPDAPAPPEFDDNEFATATWVHQHGQVAGRGTNTLAGATALYIPLQAAHGTVGVLALERASTEAVLSEEWRMLQAFADLIAVAIERLRLVGQAQRAEFLARMDKLHLALLDSVSHDLRTPLASILGSVTSVLEGEQLYDADERRNLLETIRDEASRMNRLIGNLLDMARVESGTLRLKWDWCEVADIVGVALARFTARLGARPVKVSIAPDLPLVWADFVLIEQVIANLVDNALKYSPEGSEIEIAARLRDGETEVAVLDRGLGIPADNLERVFDKFYRAHQPGQTVGTGLGLPICRGIVEAHGGTIQARQRPGGGTEVAFALPAGPEQPATNAGEQEAETA